MKALRKTFHTPGYEVSAYRERPRYDDHAGERTGLRCSQKIDHDSDDDSADGSLTPTGITVIEEDLDESETWQRLGFHRSPDGFVFREPHHSADIPRLKGLAHACASNDYIVAWNTPEGDISHEGSDSRPDYHDALMEVLKKDGSDKFFTSAELRGSKSAGWSLYAKHDLAEGVPIGKDGGALWEVDRFEEMAREEPDKMFGLLTVDVNARELFRKFGYDGPDMVQDSSTHGTVSRFLQDPSWHRQDVGTEPNVGAFVVLTKTTPYVHVVYFTLREVKSGEELGMAFGQSAWDRISAIQLAGQARASRSYARRRVELIDAARRMRHANSGKRVFANFVVPPEPPLSEADKGRVVYYDTTKSGYVEAADGTVMISADAPTGDVDKVLLAIETGGDANVRWLRPKKRKKEATCEGEAVFTSCNVEHLETLDATALSQPVLDALLECEPNDRDKAAWSAHGARLTALANGTSSFVTPRQLHDPTSPILAFALPDEDVYGAYATAEINEGDPFLIYTGMLKEKDDPTIDEENHYLYDITKENMGRGYDGPDLVVDPLRKGGVARFINSSWSPDGFKQRQINCEPCIVFHPEDHLPMIVYFAARKIRRGEEIIADYGPQFWNVAFKQLMTKHTHYCLKARAHCKVIEDAIRARNPGGVPENTTGIPGEVQADKCDTAVQLG